MATRMLFAMIGNELNEYRTFLLQMDQSLRQTLSTYHIMDFIHQATGRCCPPFSLPHALSPLRVCRTMSSACQYDVHRSHASNGVSSLP